ncbi:nucleotidyltransferase family protein [Thalassovita aquimarina]|uniref:Nucleotidyltransferase family protein n=1 Tax=Thalassovita aquimarina TaxID=2785917 RepID=A0ABS5HPR5_9RHOB|nr:nucleotidyltransferase family protein [Thalassovita aquimarina]MBR9650941.1 nucleotidyltransferase family protein [Thalassovita aquimarina]
MPDVTAIILAAGLSRRMGERNKLLLPVSDILMIRHMIDTYSAATAGRVVVVTGHQATEVEAALAGSGVKTVFNANYAQGQRTSVACGLRAAGDADKVLIGLGGQLLLIAHDIRDLLAAYAAADTSRISIPAVDQQRGNPIVVPTNLRARLLADPRSPGCKKFTRAHPEHAQFHALASPGFNTDVDTPEAFAALKAGKLEEIT